MELDKKWNPGTPVYEVFKVSSDEILEIGLTPNRNDAMGHLGVARDLRAGLMHGTVSEFTQTKLDKIATLGGSKIDFSRGLKRSLKVSVEENDLAFRYILVEFDNVNIAPSPEHAQRFLRGIGCAPINLSLIHISEPTRPY